MLKNLFYILGIIAFVLLSLTLILFLKKELGPISPPSILPSPNGSSEAPLPDSGNRCRGRATKDYKCPSGCGFYGNPVNDCVSAEFLEFCNKPGSNCVKCLSSSTNIEAQRGEVNVRDLGVGILIWTLNGSGEKELQPIIKLSSMEVGENHKMSHIKLVDGRELDVSPSHPTADGRLVRDLRVDETYDNATIQFIELVPYKDTKTHDLLPAGDTGFYFANGILMGSTLK